MLFQIVGYNTSQLAQQPVNRKRKTGYSLISYTDFDSDHKFPTVIILAALLT